MQTIERYGVVALLFLIVTVLAVIIWDGEPSGDATAKVRAAERNATARRATPEASRRSLRAEPAVEPGADSPGAPDSPGSREESREGPRVELRLKPVPRPLSRDEEAPPAGLRAGRDGLRVARETTAGDRASSAPPRRAVAPEDEPVSEPARRPESAPRERIYVVRASDTLSEISQAELGTAKRWREILLLNPGLDPARLAVGQKIRLPGGTSPAARAASAAGAAPTRAATTTDTAAPPPAKVAAGPTHRVRAGDSLWKIAAQRLGDGERWREIAALNPTLDPNHLIVGREIVLPSGAAARTAPIVASNTGSQQAGSARRGRVR